VSATALQIAAKAIKIIAYMGGRGWWLKLVCLGGLLGQLSVLNRTHHYTKKTQSGKEYLYPCSARIAKAQTGNSGHKDKGRADGHQFHSVVGEFGKQILNHGFLIYEFKKKVSFQRVGLKNGRF
jgi:hypothetical protein